jgi:hypothetical protein
MGKLRIPSPASGFRLETGGPQRGRGDVTEFNHEAEIQTS